MIDAVNGCAKIISEREEYKEYKEKFDKRIKLILLIKDDLVWFLANIFSTEQLANLCCIWVDGNTLEFVEAIISLEICTVAFCNTSCRKRKDSYL